MGYRIYRAIRVNKIEEVNFSEMGISWAVDELSAINFGEQFGQDYIVVSAMVDASQINIGQTNAQWLSSEHGSEGEVVLNNLQDIVVEFDGQSFQARIDDRNINSDETRPAPVECEQSEITDYLN